MAHKTFTVAAASEIAAVLSIDWTAVRFDIEQFLMGLNVELEHGLRDPATNVTGDDPVLTGKIALAHLKELPDYYTRLAAMEVEATETTSVATRRIRRARMDLMLRTRHRCVRLDRPCKIGDRIWDT